ncbi:hypothetical protein JW962_03225 [Candidatus Dojkabacteria bacterium]|nr:hypothetical protein [Candidatus Dojkabacteria bacterium]
MKILPKIVFTVFTLMFFSLFSLFNPVYATSSELNRKYIDAISLVIPDITDDPNQTITFTPVSGETIELQIDGAGFNAISNPYKFNSLTIGSHKLDFKYIDAAEITQTFTFYMVIIPREARFNPPTLVFDENAAVTFSGTALPSASVEFWLIGNSEVTYKTVAVDSDGNWSLDLSGLLACGNYQLVSMVRKNGLSSSTSAPLNISYCKSGTAVVNNDNSNDLIGFDFNKLWENLINTVQQHGGIVIAGVGILLLGVSGGLIYSSIAVKRVRDETRKILVSAIRGDDKPSLKNEAKQEPQVVNESPKVVNEELNSKGKKIVKNKTKSEEETLSEALDTSSSIDVSGSEEKVKKNLFAKWFGFLKKKKPITPEAKEEHKNQYNTELKEETELEKLKRSLEESKTDTKESVKSEESIKPQSEESVDHETSKPEKKAEKSSKTNNKQKEKEVKNKPELSTKAKESENKEPSARLSRDEFLEKFNQLQKRSPSKGSRISLTENE